MLFDFSGEIDFVKIGGVKRDLFGGYFGEHIKILHDEQDII